MRADSACSLCLPELRAPVVREVESWRVALNANQNLLGKLIIVLRRHEEVVAALTTSERNGLFTEVQWATARLREAFAPDHFNYAFLQNEDRHVHLHVIPRYAGPRRIAGIEFRDAAWPAHYEVGVSRSVSPEAMEAIGDALSLAAPH